MKNSIVKNHHYLLLVYALFLILFLAQTKVVAQSAEPKYTSQLEYKAYKNFTGEHVLSGLSLVLEERQ